MCYKLVEKEMQPNEIDWLYLEWAIDNKECISSGQINIETRDALRESISRVHEMFVNFDKLVEEVESSNLLQAIDKLVDD
jgi:hypothetical protein